MGALAEFMGVEEPVVRRWLRKRRNGFLFFQWIVLYVTVMEFSVARKTIGQACSVDSNQPYTACDAIGDLRDDVPWVQEFIEQISARARVRFETGDVA